MKSIDNIIFNALASRRSVGLPQIGALSVEHTPAKMTDGKITPPANMVKVREDWPEDTASVIEMIRLAGGIPEADAENSYYTWLSEARTKDAVRIEGTGVIVDGKFYPSDELENYLNPAGKNGEFAKNGKKRFSKAEKIWFVLIAIMILILAGGWGIRWYRYGNKYNDGVYPGKKEQKVAERPAGTAPVSRGDSTKNTDTLPEQQITTEPTSGQTGMASGQDAKMPERPAAAVDASGKPYHVVGGVFSRQANADKFIKSFLAEYPDADCRKFDYKNGLILVSVYSSATESDAVNYRNKIARELDDQEIWVYKSKTE